MRILTRKKSKQEVNRRQAAGRSWRGGIQDMDRKYTGVGKKIDRWWTGDRQ